MRRTSEMVNSEYERCDKTPENKTVDNILSRQLDTSTRRKQDQTTYLSRFSFQFSFSQSCWLEGMLTVASALTIAKQNIGIVDILLTLTLHLDALINSGNVKTRAVMSIILLVHSADQKLYLRRRRN